MTSSEAREGRARVAVPFEVLDDNVVEVKLWSGDEFTVLSRAHVETIAEFSFTSTFLRKEPQRVARNRATGLVATQLSVTHCCSGGHIPCAQMCVECQGPNFFCNLIECDIECTGGPYSSTTDLVGGVAGRQPDLRALVQKEAANAFKRPLSSDYA